MAERHDQAGDFGSVGGYGLSGLLRGLGDLLHQAASMSSRAGGEQRQPEVQSHMTVRTVGGEDIGADFFGLRAFIPTHGTPHGAEPHDAGAGAPPADRREPLVDIIATDDSITTIVELPGAEPGTLVIRVDHDMLTIAASGQGVDYAAEALLPAPVVDGAREQSFRNGVLELTWPRAEKLA